MMLPRISGGFLLFHFLIIINYEQKSILGSVGGGAADGV